jgi:hypothetical protein
MAPVEAARRVAKKTWSLAGAERKVVKRGNVVPRGFELRLNRLEGGRIDVNA